jgi:ornithine decarboxylase
MKFGVHVQEAPLLLDAAKSAGMSVIGISFHVGSGCMDPPVFRRAIQGAKSLFEYGRHALGFDEMSVLDIGGGFPGNTGTSIKEIAAVVNDSLDVYFPEGCGVKVIAEPGRFYVASAFTLNTLVHSMRELKEGKDDEEKSKFMIYINDGVYGSFNCVLYDHALVSPDLLRVN